jgi:hypothetical protein
MSNLLSIEQAFLSNAQVKSAMNLTEIKALQRTIDNAKKKKFTTTLALSKHVSKAYEWFKSDEGQQLCEAEGISWTAEEFATKVFGWQKSFFHKVVKVAKVEDEIIERFNAECDRLESEGENPKRSVENLLKFAKAVESGATEGGEGAEDGEGDGAEAAVETRAQVAFTMTFKDGHNANVSVRIDENGKMTTTNSLNDIKRALMFLCQNEQYLEMHGAQ